MMYQIKNKIVVLFLGGILLVACHGLEDLNENPNAAGQEIIDPNLIMPTVIKGTGKTFVGLGFGDLAGVVQHTQKDGWSSGHNSYDWSNDSHSWNGYYTLLKNNQTMIEKSEIDALDFHLGVGLVLKSYLFGLVTDLWGDAPYSEALKGDLGFEYFDSPFDEQLSIYQNIFSDLDRANTLLSKEEGDYIGVEDKQDILYNGAVSKWRKFANSLALRYYMRLSVKEPTLAQQGIGNIVSNPSKYPLILDAEDDANMAYIGNTSDDSWPTNTKFDESSQGAYFRIKMAKTLVDALQELDDPRLGVWANKVAEPIVLETDVPDDYDEVIDGERHVSQAIVDAYESSYGYPVDYDKEYIGLPTGLTLGAAYNLSEDVNQGTFNKHASQLNDIYKEANGPLLQARLMSAAEVNFILAEAAQKGWVSGSAEQYYNEGIFQSFNAWGVVEDYGDYISGAAAYSGYDDILEQKWIASWSAASEAWFDYRRTGLPDLQSGKSAKRDALPLRFYYHINELDNNTENAEQAINRLEPTEFLGDDASNNSAWSKMWLLQGTNKPY